MTEWEKNDVKPEFGGEYNVVWNLEDGEYPLVTSMEWHTKESYWTDPRCDDKIVPDHLVLFWAELPEPPEGIDKKIWSVEIPDEIRNSVYGQCMHGENMAICDICNSYK